MKDHKTLYQNEKDLDDLELQPPMKYKSKNNGYECEIYNISYQDQPVCIRFTNKYVSLIKTYEFGKPKEEQYFTGYNLRITISEKEKEFLDKIHTELRLQYKGKLKPLYITKHYTDSVKLEETTVYSLFSPIKKGSTLGFIDEESFDVSEKVSKLDINLRCIFHGEYPSKITTSVRSIG